MDSGEGKKSWLGCLLLIAMMVPSYLLQGFVLGKLWGWYVGPRFGLGELTIGEAIGIAMTFNFLTHSTSTEKWKVQDGKLRERTTTEAVSDAIVWLVVYPLGVLAIAWGWHYCGPR